MCISQTFNRFLVFLAASAMMACASTFKVVSDPPDAEVFVTSEGSAAEKKSLGKTPLEMPKEELAKNLPENAASGGFFTLVITKQGFKEQRFSLPASSSFGTTLTQLDVKLISGQDEIEIKAAEEAINKLFLAQRLALTQQFERAIIEVDQILTRYPKFARALSMKGSIFFAQKKFDESLKWYDEALKADPQMEETVKLAAKAREAMSGGRKPAATK